MAFRYYLLPLAVDARNRRSPKYVISPDTAPDGINCLWSHIFMGHEMVTLMGAEVTPEQHAELIGHADVTAIPLDIDQQVGAAEATVEAVLESYNIPAHWVSPTHTYRQIMRVIATLFLFLQRLSCFEPERIFNGRALSTLFVDLPGGLRSRLNHAANTYGLDYSFVNDTTTVRDLLIAYWDQMKDRPITIMGRTI